MDTTRKIRKTYRVKNATTFVRRSWVELVPTFIVFVFEIFGRISDSAGVIQASLDRPKLVIIISLGIIWMICISGVIVQTKAGNSDANSASIISGYNAHFWLRFGIVTIPPIILLVAGIFNILDGNTGYKTTLMIYGGLAILWVSSIIGLISTDNTFSNGSRLNTKNLFLFCIIYLPILMLSSFIFLSHHSDKKVILVALFDNGGGSDGDMRVNQILPDRLKKDLSNFEDLEVKPINRTFSNKREALDVGLEYNASIVIWGSYIAKTSSALMNINFETPCLKCSPDLGSKLQGEQIQYDDIQRFSFEFNLSQNMATLSSFVIALTHVDSDDWKGSIAILDRIIGDEEGLNLLSDKHQSLIYLYRAIAYSRLSKDEFAFNDVNKAIILDPDNSIAFSYRAGFYSGKGQYQLAIKDYQEAIDKGILEKCKYTLYNFGATYYNAGDYDMAISTFKRALNVADNYGDIYVYLGYSYNGKGEHKNAIDSYTMAIQEGGQHASYYVGRGDAHLALGEDKQALEDFKVALSLEPSTAYVNQALADFYAGKKEPANAITYYTIAISAEPQNAYLYHQRGKMLLLQGLTEPAKDDLQKALKFAKGEQERKEIENTLHSIMTSEILLQYEA